MQFANLVDHPEFFALVAQWNWEEWSSLLVERSAPEFEQWLRTNLRRDGIPTTLLAFDGRTVIGTVSVIDQDLEIPNEFSPWLASLYVVPERRGRGLGRALVQAAMAEARRHGCKTLHLYTPGQEAFYAALGWVPVTTMAYRGRSITIMRRTLEGVAAEARATPSPPRRSVR